MMREKMRMVVLDDDPTGIQTVHGCLLLTQWDVDSLRRALDDSAHFFYVLTNTRAMTASQAAAVVEEVMRNVLAANDDRGYQLIFVSRSDSCLRGHFPIETDVMRRVLNQHGVGVRMPIPFVPAFIESGRVTIGGAHFMRDNGGLIPLSESEFARDNVFGYRSSVLADYILEKGGRVEDYETVDAEDYSALNNYAGALLDEASRFDGAVVIRSSSSLPKALSGIADISLLDRNALKVGNTPGCFVVGSHVGKTTRQLSCLLEAEGTRGVEVNVQRITNNDTLLFEEIIQQVDRIVSDGMTPVIFTSRQEIRLDNAAQRQALGVKVSDFLVDIVRRLPFTPAYLVGKGGITSHDILTKGLGVKSARVLGQVVNSVPCVMAKRFPYIIFPGNVGSDTSLREVYEKMRG